MHRCLFNPLHATYISPWVKIKETVGGQRERESNSNNREVAIRFSSSCRCWIMRINLINHLHWRFLLCENYFSMILAYVSRNYFIYPRISSSSIHPSIRLVVLAPQRRLFISSYCSGSVVPLAQLIIIVVLLIVNIRVNVHSPKQKHSK